VKSQWNALVFSLNTTHTMLNNPKKRHDSLVQRDCATLVALCYSNKTTCSKTKHSQNTHTVTADMPSRGEEYCD